MSMAEIRDIAIIVVGVLAIILILLMIALTALLLVKVGPILDSAKGTLSNVRGTSTFVSDMAVKPIVRTLGFASGVRKAVGVILSLTRRKKGG